MAENRKLGFDRKTMDSEEYKAFIERRNKALAASKEQNDTDIAQKRFPKNPRQHMDSEEYKAFIERRNEALKNAKAANDQHQTKFSRADRFPGNPRQIHRTNSK